MSERICLAVDVGGSSVKVLAARYTAGRVEIIDQYSVATQPVSVGGHVHIDVPELIAQIQGGIRGLRSRGIAPQTMGIDTFGNGYGFLDSALTLQELPYFYKDARTKGVLELMGRVVPIDALYQSSGVYPTDIRVLMQLFYETRRPGSPIHRCRWMLLLPDLLNFCLTGQIAAEESMASVADLLDVSGRQWNTPLLERLGIPTGMLPPLVKGGHQRHAMTAQAAQAAGGSLDVVTVTSHDTESALLAAPGLSTDKVFASIGTSLIFGTRTDRVIVSRQGYEGAFKSMKGPFGFSLCRDFNAMWLFEQCMRLWRQENPSLRYDDVTDACRRAGNNGTYLNVCDPSLRTEGGNILDTIAAYCRDTGQQPPRTLGETANCIFDSIVLQSLWSLEQIKQITGRPSYRGLVAIGGGVRNALLTQRLADALNMPVTTGSGVSSALGNVLMQLHATGELPDEEAVRRTAQTSFISNTFLPQADTQGKWEKALLTLNTIDKIRGFWR